MAQITVSYILELAEQLTSAEQSIVIQQLQSRQPVTRESLLAAFEKRKSVGGQDTLYFGKYANPDVELSAEALENTLREAATAWEEDLDDLIDNP